MFGRRSTILALFLLGAAPSIHAAGVDQTPFPVVETELHTGSINRLAALGDGKSFVSVSDDKTLRIWATDTLAPRSVLRPPIGARDDGALYAVATTERWLATGGRIPDMKTQTTDGRRLYAVTLYSLPSYSPRLVSGLAAPVTAMKFSPDGSLLALGMAQFGVVVLDLKQKGKSSDQDYQGAVTWLDFDGKNRLVVAAEDGDVRLYDANRKPVARQKLGSGSSPWSVAFSPDGSRVAVGELQKPVVHLLDGATLKPMRELAGAAQRKGGLGVAAFALDGQSIFAGGTYTDMSGRSAIRRIPLDNKPPSETPVSDDSVTDLLPVGNAVVFATAEPSVGRLDAGGKTLVTKTPHFDFRTAARDMFRVSADGNSVLLASAGNGPKLVFNAEQRVLSPADSVPKTMIGATDQTGGTTVANWRNGTSPLLNGKPIAMEPHEHSRSVAVSAAAHGAAIGTDFFVRFIGQNNWAAVVPAPAWAVNISADGKRVVAGLGDGSVHWYDAASGDELAMLFVEPPTKRWVLASPEGYFDHDRRTDGTPDGRSLIGYRFNQTDGASSQSIEIGQLYPVFFRPDLIGLSLRHTEEAKTLIRDQVERLGDIRRTLDRGLPAQIELVEVCGVNAVPSTPSCPTDRSLDTPDAGGDAKLTTTAGMAMVRYRLTNPDGDPGRAQVRRDDAVIAPALLVESEGRHDRIEAALVQLAEGVNKIRVTPISRSGEVEASEEASLAVPVARVKAAATTRSVPGGAVAEQTSAPVVPTPSEPELYMLSVGIDQYQGPDMTLNNAAADARAVADAMRLPSAPIYRTAHVTTLFDEQATIENIDAALRDIAAKARVDDMVVIFFAGHGISVDGQYYFAPVGFAAAPDSLYRRSFTMRGLAADQAYNRAFQLEGLSQDHLIGLIQTIQANRFALILDTCYSAQVAGRDAVLQGNKNETVTSRLGHSGGRFVLSSATASALDAAAVPGPDGIKHGLLTSIILEALTGKADNDHNGRIDVANLAKYAKTHVLQEAARQNAVQDARYYFAGGELFDIRTVLPAR